MSLVGNLEDLGLGDILQIVSLSRKSGILFISDGDKEGKIIFRNGQVVRCFSSDRPVDLRRAVKLSGLLSEARLDEMIACYEKMGPDEGIELLLTGRMGLSRGDLDVIRKKHIEESAYALFAWNSGTFNFELKDVDSLIEEGSDFFIYPHGINPQFLAMEGTRRHDEAQRDLQVEARQETDASIIEPTVPDEAGGRVFNNDEERADRPMEESGLQISDGDDLPEPGESAPFKQPPFENVDTAIVIVDDDRRTLMAVRHGLADRNFTVFAEEKSEKALHIISRLDTSGARVIVVADLIMPRMDGTGILGGIELLELLTGGFPQIPVILMTDHVNREAETRARSMGAASYCDKPKRIEFADEYDEEKITRFMDELEHILAPLVGNKKNISPAAMAGMVDIAEGLQDEFEALGKILPAHSVDLPPPSTPGLLSLKSLIEELNSPEGRRQILLLTLRFASELMNRAVIFLVKEDFFEGFGQFGVELDGALADKRIRAMKLSRHVPSILNDVLQSRRMLKQRMADNEGNRYLIEQFGGKKPKESFAGPIITDGRVSIIVYGDNVPAYEAIGDTSAFEIFLMQAGVAMERVLLEKKVQEYAGM